MLGCSELFALLCTTQAQDRRLLACLSQARKILEQLGEQLLAHGDLVLRPPVLLLRHISPACASSCKQSVSPWS